MTKRIFLSHSSKDVDAVEWIVSHARPLGIEVYRAEHDLQAGQPLAAKIETEIETCDAFIALLTSNGFSSQYVNQEIGLAKGRGKPIIPVLDRSVAGRDLALLNGLEWVLLDASALGESCEALTASLHKLVHAQAGTRGMRVDPDVILTAAAILLLFVAFAYYSK